MKNNVYKRLQKRLVYLFLCLTAIVMGGISCVIAGLNHYANIYSIKGSLKESDFLLFYLRHDLEINIFLIVAGIVLLLFLFISLFFRNMNVLIHTLQGVQEESPPLYFRKIPEFLIAKDKVDAMLQKRNESQALSIQEKEHKNELLMYLAHDLKTPLTSMIGYINHILDHKVDDEQLKSSIQIAHEKAERLDDLLDEFSEILRYDDKVSQLELIRLDLSTLIHQQLAGFYPLLEKKEIRLEVQLADELELIGDFDKLLRVFDNLMRNAINYSNERSVIEITGIMDKGSIVLSYKNEGEMIDQNTISHLFDKFYRASTARTSTSGGAGLGLAIAKEIVELHHGTIGVKTDGIHITFTICLPCTQEDFL